METVTIQIGNSDDKLSQKEWVNFINETRQCAGKHCGQIHFDGASKFDSVWQNVCIVAEIYEIDKENLMNELRTIRKKYRQYAIAVTLGQTAMV